MFNCRFWLLCFGLLGCTDGSLPPPDPGTQFGSEQGGPCDIDSEDVLTDLTAVPPGFTTSPQDVITVLGGPWDATPGSPESTYSIDIEGDVVLIEQSAQPDPSGIEIAPPDCDSYYAMNARVQVETADGALRETVDVPLQASASGTASWTTTIEASDIGGSATPPWDPSTPDRVWLDLTGFYDGSDWTIQANWLAEFVNGDTVSVEQVALVELSFSPRL